VSNTPKWAAGSWSAGNSQQPWSVASGSPLDPAAAGDQCETAAYVYLGNMIAHFMGQGCGHHPLALQSRSEALEILKLRGDCLPRFMIKTEEQLGKLTLLFNQSFAHAN
jgi:hypothetical protein